MTNNLKIRNQDDYILNEITLISHDGKEYNFLEQFVEFSFEESVFEVGTHGSMFVIDSIDFPTLLPMIGEERLRISFTRQDETVKEGALLDPIEFEMPIYKLDGKKQDGESKKRQSYTLYYCSDEVFNNLNTRIFKTYKNIPYSDMVKDIFQSSLNSNKKIVIEETKDVMTYFCQNISPIKAIKKLADRSTSKEDNGYFYVFYEDRDQFNFVTLGKLSKQDPIATYKYLPKNVSKNTEGLSHKPKDIEKDLYNADQLDHESGYDVLHDATSGEGTSSLLTVDPIRRKFKLKAFDLRGESSSNSHGMELLPNSSWDSFVHTDKAKPWKDTNKMFVHPLTNLSVVVTDFGQDTQEYISERDPTINPYNPEEFFTQTISNKKQFLRNIITTTVSGDPRIKAGCTIQFDIPEILGKTGDTSGRNKEELDKYIQGKYVVVSVAHVVKIGEYKLILELIKDSFFSDIESRDPVEEYKNII